jgi:hypothetical protein
VVQRDWIIQTGLKQPGAVPYINSWIEIGGLLVRIVIEGVKLLRVFRICKLCIFSTILFSPSLRLSQIVLFH